MAIVHGSELGNSLYFNRSLLICLYLCYPRLNNSPAEFFFFGLPVFIFQHFFFSPARTPAFLPPDFFALLLFRTFDPGHFFFEFITQFTAREKSVRRLQARLLTFYFNAGRRVPELHARRGFINFLPAFAGAANKLLAQILCADSERRHPRTQFFPFFRRDHPESKPRRWKK